MSRWRGKKLEDHTRHIDRVHHRWNCWIRHARWWDERSHRTFVDGESIQENADDWQARDLDRWKNHLNVEDDDDSPRNHSNHSPRTNNDERRYVQRWIWYEGHAYAKGEARVEGEQHANQRRSIKRWLRRTCTTRLFCGKVRSDFLPRKRIFKDIR